MAQISFVRIYPYNIADAFLIVFAKQLVVYVYDITRIPDRIPNTVEVNRKYENVAST